MKNKVFYKNGGVTFSGGEPLIQAPFLIKLSQEFKKHNVHITLDTSGCILNQDVMTLLNIVDLILLDIKFTNNEDYYNNTRGDFSIIKQFIDYSQKIQKPIIVRQVIINDINDKIENIKSLQELTRSYKNIKGIELLPYHSMAIEKYNELNIDYPLKDVLNTPLKTMTKLNNYIKEGSYDD